MDHRKSCKYSEKNKLLQMTYYDLTKLKTKIICSFHS